MTSLSLTTIGSLQIKIMHCAGKGMIFRSLVFASIQIISGHFSGIASGQPYISQRASVELDAVVQTGPNRITLQWINEPGITETGYDLNRKIVGASSFSSLAQSIGASETQYIDNNVTPGVHYEYQLVRYASEAPIGYGFISSGIELPPVHSRGKIILMIDGALATSLNGSISTLIQDLRGDGWQVVSHNVAGGSTIVNVRSTIKADYDLDPTNVRAVYLIGHIPVPYAGAINPDDHGDARYPCDGFYGEMTATYTTGTDATKWMDVNPADNLLDNVALPSPIEIQVGRIDLFGMTQFDDAGLNEVGRMQYYLGRVHQYKVKQFTPAYSGIVFDNFEDVVDYPLAAGGYRTVSALVGKANFSDPSGNGSPFSSYVLGGSQLWTYASGGGGAESANNVGSTQVYAQAYSAANVFGGAFNMTFGSYFGNWDQNNAFLKAPLCIGALTNAWSGIPFWNFHHMGMGENIGYSTWVTMNNQYSYWPQTGGWQSAPYTTVHLGLMGDPSLRTMMVAPPSGLVVSSAGGMASFTWNAASGASHYFVYKFNAAGAPVLLSNVNGITTTSFTSTTEPYSPGSEYMVRAAKLEVSATGSYWNLSLGAFGSAPGFRALLKGAYDQGSGLMSDQVRAAGIIPLAQPYTALGFPTIGGAGNETINAAVLAVEGNDAIVDWVRVELRDAANPASVVYARQGLLQRDGDIVDLNGVSQLVFGSQTGAYYVAVRHRNHLSAMTLTPIVLVASKANVNYSTDVTYGNGAEAIVGNLKALWSGNVVQQLNPTLQNQNQLLYTGSGNDRDPVLVRVGSTTPNNVVGGYYVEDVNMDGLVKYTGSGNDRDPILINVGSTTPNNTRQEQLPF